MVHCAKIAASAAVALAISGGAAHAAVSIDGSIGTGEWSGTPLVTTSSPDFQLSVQSDPTNLYFLGNVTGDTSAGIDKSTGFDVFDINIGLDGNTAPWRYALNSRNNSFGGSAFPTSLSGDWEGRWQAGDDDGVSNATFGVPDNVTNAALPAGIQWAVDEDGNRVHEIAIPWTVLLDGQNGWERSDAITLAIAGTIVANDNNNGTSFPATTVEDRFGDQGTYAKVTVSAVPLPAAAWLFIGGLGAVGAVARRRAQRA
jgi:hypothetical protein